MFLPRCPHCKVILTDDEAAGVACPVCAAALRDDSPALPPENSQLWLVPAVGAAILACVVVTWVVWARQQEKADAKPDPVALDAPKKPDRTGQQPAPKNLAQVPTDPEPITAEPHVEQEAVVRAETLPFPAVENEAPAVKAVVVGDSVVFNQPDDDVTIDRVAEDTKLRLSGRVKSLTIADVSEAAIVDASKLQAKRVVVRGINGGTKVIVKADEVVFEGAINGDADVIVESPGKVTFSSAEGIGGSCRLDVKARDVDFRGPVVGGVRVLVTLASGGSLRFAKTDGGAVLQWRKASGDDPTPKFHKGEIKGGSRFVEAPKKSDDRR